MFLWYRQITNYILSIKPRRLYAWANILINPLGVFILLQPVIFSDYNWFPIELWWAIFIWTILSSLTNDLTKDIVSWLIKNVFDLGVNGLEKWGFLGFLIIAVLFAVIGNFALVVALIILWIQAWTIINSG